MYKKLLKYFKKSKWMSGSAHCQQIYNQLKREHSSSISINYTQQVWDAFSSFNHCSGTCQRERFPPHPYPASLLYSRSIIQSSCYSFCFLFGSERPSLFISPPTSERLLRPREGFMMEKIRLLRFVLQEKMANVNSCSQKKQGLGHEGMKTHVFSYLAVMPMPKILTSEPKQQGSQTHSFIVLEAS